MVYKYDKLYSYDRKIIQRKERVKGKAAKNNSKKGLHNFEEKF